MKIWSLPKHENLTTGKKYCGTEEKLLLRSNFSYFQQYFRCISNFKSPITHIFVKCGCSNYFFLNSANLLCRGMDISKYFRESLGIRDNESRLYVKSSNLIKSNPSEIILDPALVSFFFQPKSVHSGHLFPKMLPLKRICCSKESLDAYKKRLDYLCFRREHMSRNI